MVTKRAQYLCVEKEFNKEERKKGGQVQRCLPKKERTRVLRRRSGETSGGISRASDGHVDDEGDNIRGALAVFACEVRYPKQATVQQEQPKKAEIMSKHGDGDGPNLHSAQRCGNMTADADRRPHGVTVAQASGGHRLIQQYRFTYLCLV